MGEKIIKTSGLFLARRNVAIGDKTIFCGVVQDNLIPDNEEKEEIWLCELRIVPVKKFNTNERIKGMRIDQILCSSIPESDLTEIPCDGEEVAVELNKQEWAEDLFNA